MIPDPHDERVLFEFARRVHNTPETIKAGVYSTIREFTTVLEDAPQKNKFTIWYLSFAPVFSYYLFDDVVVLSLYKRRRAYDFVRLEPKAIMDEKTLLKDRFFATVESTSV